MKTREKWLLVSLPLVSVLPVLPAAISGARHGNPLMIAGVAVVVICVAAASLFWFPEQTVERAQNFAHRTVHKRTGNLDIIDINWLVDKHLPRYRKRHPLGSGIPAHVHTDQFRTELVAWIRIRTGQPTGTSAMGRTVVRWLARREDLVLLRNALCANLSAPELNQHLDRRLLLDDQAVAMLAALVSGNVAGPSSDGDLLRLA